MHSAPILIIVKKNINKDLELKNFAAAGEVLAEIWSNMVIDGHPVQAEYIQPKEITSKELPDMHWYSNHVRESQYFLQIVKCDDNK